MNSVTTIGVIGSFILLVLFILNQIGKLSRESFWYDLGNFIGAAFLSWYAYLLGSIPFLVRNFMWAAFSFRDALRSSNE